MKLPFQSRVALFNTVAASLIIALVYAIIFAVVYIADFGHLDDNIRQEKKSIMSRVEYSGDSILINGLSEWDKRQVGELETEPVFAQVTNNSGNIIFQSSNLFQKYVLSAINSPDERFFNKVILKQHFRRGQFPIWGKNSKRIGTLNIAVSRQESYVVLHNLLLALCFSYPIVNLLLYFSLLFSASKAIAPVRKLIVTASDINDTNISTRLPLPDNEDEIYLLATTINDLLDRIERSMINQKQFTADASHEMRTPLSAMRGILEVCLRKAREPKHYENKIKQAIVQVDRMHMLMEQMLQIARLNAGVITAKFVPVNLKELLMALPDKWTEQLDKKNISLQITIPADKEIVSDFFLLELIIDNLLSNAIKYGREGGRVCIQWDEADNALIITDDGEGIAAEHIPHLFERFYRVDESRNSKVPGYGLGLAIVKRIATLLNVNVGVSSEEGEGTTFILYFSYGFHRLNLSQT